MKNQMRKPTYSEIYMYKNLFWVAVAAFIFLPVISELLFRIVYLYAATDIAYRWLASPVDILREIITVASNYIGLGVLCVSVAYFGKNAAGVVRLALISHALDFVTYLLAYYLYTAEVASVILIILIDSAVNLLVTVIIWLAVKTYAEKKNANMNIEPYNLGSSMLKHIYTKVFVLASVIFGTVQLGFVVYDMIDAFLDPSLGTPINVKETLYWVLEYVYVLLYAALGLVIMVLIGLYAQKLRESGKQKVRAIYAQKNTD